MQKLTPSYFIEPVLEGLDFHRRNPRLWLREKAHAWNLVGLQKSVLGPQFFINLGVWFPALDTNPRPRPQDCHIQIRLNEVSSNAEDLVQALDLEDAWKMDDDSRRFEFFCALKDADRNVFKYLRQLKPFLDTLQLGRLVTSLFSEICWRNCNR